MIIVVEYKKLLLLIKCKSTFSTVLTLYCTKYIIVVNNVKTAVIYKANYTT